MTPPYQLRQIETCWISDPTLRMARSLPYATEATLPSHADVLAYGDRRALRLRAVTTISSRPGSAPLCAAEPVPGWASAGAATAASSGAKGPTHSGIAQTSSRSSSRPPVVSEQPTIDLRPAPLGTCLYCRSKLRAGPKFAIGDGATLPSHASLLASSDRPGGWQLPVVVLPIACCYLSLL
jgi:hypothetical protein